MYYINTSETPVPATHTIIIIIITITPGDTDYDEEDDDGFDVGSEEEKEEVRQSRLNRFSRFSTFLRISFVYPYFQKTNYTAMMTPTVAVQCIFNHLNRIIIG